MKWFALSLFFSINIFSQARKPLRVNHFYMVVDHDSFEGFRKDDDLNKIFSQDCGLPKFSRNTDSATTIYLRFKNVYIEMMGPENKFKEPVGTVGIGFSFDTRMPFIYDVKDYQSNKNIQFLKGKAEYGFEGKKMTWYESYYRPYKDNLAVWYAFYNPEFISRLDKKFHQTFTRSKFLDLSFDKSSAAKKITRIYVECSVNSYTQLKNELDNFNINSESTNEGLKFRLGEIDLFLKENKDSDVSKIYKIVFKTDQLNFQDKKIGNIVIRKKDELEMIIK